MGLALLGVLVAVFLATACDKAADLKRYPIGGDFTLTDHEGRSFTLSEYRAAHPGDPVLLFFGFTHCPDVCPQTLSRLSRATALLDEDQRERVLTLLITVDPARDDAAALKQYLGQFPLRALGLHGSRAEITKIARRYAVNFYESGDPGAHADHGAHDEGGGTGSATGLINHSSQTFLIDSTGTVRYFFRPSDSVQHIADTLRLLL